MLMSSIRFAIFAFAFIPALVGCAEVRPVPLTPQGPQVKKQLVIGTDRDQALAAQKFCGDESWRLEPRGFDGTEAFAVCSGYR